MLLLLSSWTSAGANVRVTNNIRTSRLETRDSRSPITCTGLPTVLYPNTTIAMRSSHDGFVAPTALPCGVQQTEAKHSMADDDENNDDNDFDK